jgi:polyisoprenyl-teichoic acid--peptidoglycan teichoic acid transferase
VPRNLERLPLPAGKLRERFPRGFPDLANALFPYVESNSNLGPGGQDAPAQVMKGALAELLGIPIHHYVLVDMAGFVRIIDAMGGVSIVVPERLPHPGNPLGPPPPSPYIGPGTVEMDGALALAYARTRSADSDYERMRRQRCLIAAAAREMSAAELVARYNSLAEAVESAMRSDVPTTRLSDLVRIFAKVDIDTARSLVLVPPVVNPARPDVAQIRGLVFDLLNPGEQVVRSPSTAPSTAGDGARTKPQGKGSTTTVAPIETLGATC